MPLLNRVTLSLARLALATQRGLLQILFSLLFARALSTSPPKTIVVLRTCLLGDFLFALPSINELRQRFPSARIVFLSPSVPTQQVLRRAGRYVDDTKPPPWLSLVRGGLIDVYIAMTSLSLFEVKRLRGDMAALRPDRCIILSHPAEPLWGLVKKAIFLWLVGIRCPVFGWRVQANHNFLRRAQYQMGVFEHHVYGPIRAIGEMPELAPKHKVPVRFSLVLRSEDKATAAAIWHASGLIGTVVVALVPGSVQPHKCWPMEKFVQLVDRVVDRWPVAFVVLGIADHATLGNTIAARSRAKIVNLAGKTSVGVLAAVIERSSFVVGNDGGSMHLAAAIGVPAVSIIPGIEYPGSVDPWGYSALSIRHNVACSPCYSFTHCPLGHAKCMTDIPVDAVLKNCALVLDSCVHSQHGARVVDSRVQRVTRG